MPIGRWPLPFRPSEHHWGPREDEPCPCGSRRRARNCHRAADGRWLTPDAEPLLAGDLTGQSHPRCYARASGDCSSKLTSEHWISASVLESLEPVTVSGMPWQQGGQHSLSVKSLGSNILCARHNGALSDLDKLAARLFRVLRDYQADLRADVDPHGAEFALFDGATLERWLLKTFWGAASARVLGTPSGVISQVPAVVPEASVAGYLFRGDGRPEGIGMYVGIQPGALVAPRAEIDISGMAKPDGTIVDGRLAFGPLVMGFTFGTPPDIGVERHRHPQAIFMREEGSTIPQRQKIVALGWSEQGDPPVILIRQSPGLV